MVVAGFALICIEHAVTAGNGRANAFAMLNDAGETSFDVACIRAAIAGSIVVIVTVFTGGFIDNAISAIIHEFAICRTAIAFI